MKLFITKYTNQLESTLLHQKVKSKEAIQTCLHMIKLFVYKIEYMLEEVYYNFSISIQWELQSFNLYLQNYAACHPEMYLLMKSHMVSRLLLLLLSHVSHVRLCVTPQTAVHQAPLSLGFSRQEHWSGLPFPSPMHESEK